MLKNGVIVMRFDTLLGKQDVLQGGIYHFDHKPFIVKEWTHELEFTKEELKTVPIWVKFPDLDFKYWSKTVLSKIGSMIGKPIMVDQNTEARNGLKFARILVEVELDSKLPVEIKFKNEKGKLVEQPVYGHEESVCRIKKKVPKNNEKVPERPAFQQFMQKIEGSTTKDMQKKQAEGGTPQTNLVVDMEKNPAPVCKGDQIILSREGWQTPAKAGRVPSKLTAGQQRQASGYSF
ncbi:hypothetical protein P3S67_031683 [Capsicum chacoense]